MKTVNDEINVLIKIFEKNLNTICSTDKNRVFQFWKKQYPLGRVPENMQKRGENIYTVEDTNNGIAYTTTAQGYRTYDNIEFKDCLEKIFCFGCSITYGIGNTSEDTWPYLLGKAINAKPYNFGVPADSSDSIARRIFQLLSALPKGEEPNHIFILFPDVFRSEYIYNDGDQVEALQFNPSYRYRNTIQQYLESITGPESNQSKQVISSFAYSSAMTAFFNFIKNFRLIEAILESRNISWSWLTWYPLLGVLSNQAVLDYLNDKTDLTKDGLNIVSHLDYPLAKDGSHPTAQYMNVLTQQFIKVYNSCDKNH